MRSKTINLLESIQQNSITNVIDKVAEQFKSEIIEEYKASETKEMSTELENKITKALALEGVDSPEDWVADVCSVALDMTPTGEALAIKEDENIDIKGQLKQLGIESIYVADEHKRADEDELNKLGGLEYNFRLQRNPSKAHYYSYLSINHETLGDIYISFDTKTNKIDTTGFPWNFIEKAMTPEIKEFVETNEEFFNNLLKSKELGTGINLNESAILDKIGNIIPEGYKEYMLSNDFTAKTFNSKEKLLKDLKSYNITSFKDVVDNTLTINCKDMYGHRFKTIITWKHLDNKVQESANDNKLTKSIMKGMTKINYECEECGTKYSHTENINQKELDELENSTPGWVPDCPKCNTNKYVIMKSYKKITESADLKESDGPFSGVEFEKNVPHEMRFKEYNFVNINDLYWVTQQPFSLNQLNQFAEAFKNTKFSKAYVTVRDFSTYDFENDLSRNVFAIIDKYNDIIDPTGYVEAVKKEGWEKILEEAEDIINKA